jgi:hypothetical protein
MCLRIFWLDVLKELPVWGAWRSALHMFWYTNTWMLIADVLKFCCFLFIFEWNKPVHHHFPLREKNCHTVTEPEEEYLHCNGCVDLPPSPNFNKLPMEGNSKQMLNTQNFVLTRLFLLRKIKCFLLNPKSKSNVSFVSFSLKLGHWLCMPSYFDPVIWCQWRDEWSMFICVRYMEQGPPSMARRF